MGAPVETRPAPTLLCLSGCCWCGQRTNEIAHDLPYSDSNVLDHVVTYDKQVPVPFPQPHAVPCGHPVLGIVVVVAEGRTVWTLYRPGTQPPHLYPGPWAEHRGVSFVDACLAGVARPDGGQVDDWVGFWHDSRGRPYSEVLPLGDFLGLDEAEYDAWVSDADAISAIVAARTRAATATRTFEGVQPCP